MSDPEDRRHADLFEMELRRKADLDPGNAWELIWFLRLPLETRCSYARILEARIDQDATRQFLFRQSCYRQQNWRAPPVPCMSVDRIYAPSSPWSSIGRRQRRKPAKHPPRSQSKPIESLLVIPANNLPPARQEPRRRTQRSRAKHPRQSRAPPPPEDLDVVPPRPPTPEGLREALRNDTALALQSQGYLPTTGERDFSYSPALPSTPPVPQAVQFEPFTMYPPEDPIIADDGTYIDPIAAYLVTAGRYYDIPWLGYGFRNAAEDLSVLEREFPGVLDGLIHALFPCGFDDVTAATDFSPCSQVILDFVRGWSIVPDGWFFGRMKLPNPHYHVPFCPCGGD